jgi:hypothetical protein
LTKKINVYKLIDERFQTVKAAKTNQNTGSRHIIDDWDHAIEIIKTDVERKTDEVATGARSEEFNSRKQHADDNIPKIGAQSLPAPRTSAPSPRGLSWRCTRTELSTRSLTCDKFILAANTEDLKLENHSKFKEPKSAEISANYRLLQERDVETDVRAQVERAVRLCHTPSPELPQTRVTPR